MSEIRQGKENVGNPNILTRENVQGSVMAGFWTMYMPQAPQYGWKQGGQGLFQFLARISAEQPAIETIVGSSYESFSSYFFSDQPQNPEHNDMVAMLGNTLELASTNKYAKLFFATALTDLVHSNEPS
ncbi:MAG: hypothetical protein Q7S61_00445 [bacterium]|nr:hypothetical protein [bacterium]